MKSVSIDVSGVTTPDVLHDLLARHLEFQDYYGKNWDAFDECIADPVPGAPRKVILSGLNELKRALPRDAALLVDCLTYARDNGYASLEIVD